MLHKVFRAIFINNIIVAQQVIRRQIKFLAKPGGQFDQGIISLRIKTAGFVRVADLNRYGVKIARGIGISGFT